MTLTEISFKEQQQALARIKEHVGFTPMLDLSVLSPNKDVKIYAKQEWLQISGSVKARAAFAIIEDALKKGHLRNRALLDASSGNTGIAYATIGQQLGIDVHIVLPENASQERKDLLQHFGAHIIYSSPYGGTDEAQELANNMAEQNPERYFYADQYNNPNNWKAHYYGTVVEILQELGDEITHFVAALGSCGTFTGVSKRLKEERPKVKRIALQPDGPMHILEGWKHLPTAKQPGIFDASLIGEQRTIDSAESLALLRHIYQIIGVKLSPSSAANVLGALKVAEEIEQGTIVTILPDNADKYGEIVKELNL